MNTEDASRRQRVSGWALAKLFDCTTLRQTVHVDEESDDSASFLLRGKISMQIPTTGAQLRAFLVSKRSGYYFFQSRQVQLDGAESIRQFHFGTYTDMIRLISRL